MAFATSQQTRQWWNFRNALANRATTHANSSIRSKTQQVSHGDTPAPEVRTDLLSGLSPMLVVAIVDLAGH